MITEVEALFSGEQLVQTRVMATMLVIYTKNKIYGKINTNVVMLKTKFVFTIPTMRAKCLLNT